MPGIDKICSKCGVSKGLVFFSAAKAGKHGVASQCKDCIACISRLRAVDSNWRNTEFGRMKFGRVPAADEVVNSRSCTSCKEEKPLHDFYPCRKGKFGVKPRCIVCDRADAVSRRRADVEASRSYGRSYYAANREKLLKAANDNQSTPRGRIDNAVSNGVARGIRMGSKNGRRSFALVGYGLDDLMAHLEAQFEPWMSWANYGFYGWHINHIKPLSSFAYETPDDPESKKAWALSNLRPLGAVENWRKGASYTPENDNAEAENAQSSGRHYWSRQA